MDKTTFKKLWIKKLLDKANDEHFFDICLLIDGDFLNEDKTEEQAKQFIVNKIINSPDYSINKDYFIIKKDEKTLFNFAKDCETLKLKYAFVSAQLGAKYEQLRVYF